SDVVAGFSPRSKRRPRAKARDYKGGFLNARLVLMALILTASSVSAQRGERGGGGQAAGPNIPVPRMPDGTPNLGWDDPRYKGYWRSGQHWEYGKDQIDPKARGRPALSAVGQGPSRLSYEDGVERRPGSVLSSSRWTARNVDTGSVG